MQLLGEKNTSVTLENSQNSSVFIEVLFHLWVKQPNLLKSLVCCFTNTNKKILYYRFPFLLGFLFVAYRLFVDH